MAREKDEGKRQAILASAKRLFAERGFHGASVSDLARETGLPVGSIYTYFESKEAVARTVIEEGWEGFLSSLVAAFGAAASPEERLSLLVYRYLPGLFADLDFVSLVLAEAGRLVDLEAKLERLGTLVSGVVGELAATRGLAMELEPRRAMTALSLYFLGSLDTVRVSRRAGLSVGPEDVLDFIRFSIENSFGIEIGPSLIGPPPG